jgi:hypothetical protein
MCQSCKQLGEENRERRVFGERQRSHLNKGKPHCEYPETCTCRHQPVGEFVNRTKVKL